MSDSTVSAGAFAVYGKAGDPATESLLAKFVQKGFAVVLRDITVAAEHLAHFTGRGFSLFPVAFHPNGTALGALPEAAHQFLDAHPDVVPAVEQAAPQAAEQALAETVNLAETVGAAEVHVAEQVVSQVTADVAAPQPSAS